MAVFRRGPPVRPSNAGVCKNNNFRPTSHVISEMIQDRAIVTMERQWELYAINRMVPFSVTWMTPNPNFNISPLCDAEYIGNGTRYRHSYSEMLIGTYTRPTNFEMTFNSEIFNDTKHRVVSVRQVSFFYEFLLWNCWLVAICVWTALAWCVFIRSLAPRPVSSLF